MYKKILVPLDGSKRAERILPHVEKIALDNEASTLFLKVVRPPIAAGYDDLQGAKFEKQLEARLVEYTTYVKGIQGEFTAKGIKANHLVVAGSVISVILAVAHREDVDLVAMCSHGRGGLSRLFYGSVASGILNRIDRALLIIRARQNGDNIS